MHKYSTYLIQVFLLLTLILVGLSGCSSKTSETLSVNNPSEYIDSFTITYYSLDEFKTIKNPGPELNQDDVYGAGRIKKDVYVKISFNLLSASQAYQSCQMNVYWDTDVYEHMSIYEANTANITKNVEEINLYYTPQTTTKECYFWVRIMGSEVDKGIIFNFKLLLNKAKASYLLFNSQEELVSEKASYSYNMSTNSLTLTQTGTSNTITHFTIANSVMGIPVTAIGYEAFNRYQKLTTVVIPKTVTKIGSCAFMWCHKLTNLTLPEGLKTISSNAFDGCYALTLTNLPDSIELIDYAAFRSCKSLGDVTIPKNATEIDDYAFSGTLIKEVTIPEGSTYIGVGVFQGSSQLTTVTIPSTVTSIGYAAFEECPNLTTINFNGTMAQWHAINKQRTESATTTYPNTRAWNNNTGDYTVYCLDGNLSKGSSY